MAMEHPPFEGHNTHLSLIHQKTDVTAEIRTPVGHRGNLATPKTVPPHFAPEVSNASTAPFGIPTFDEQ